MAYQAVRARHTFYAFHNRSYRLLWTGNFFSYISRWMQMTLLSWLVLELTDSPWLVALVGFFAMSPMLLLGIMGGVLADRWDKRRLLISTQVANFIAGLAMAVLLFSGLIQYWHAYMVILVSGIGWALDMPSRRSVVLDLLGKGRVTNAMALDSVGMHSSRMLGPALAGLLITLIDVKGGYVVITLMYMASALMIWALQLPKGYGGSVVTRNVFRNLIEGFQYVRSNSTIMAVVIITVLMNLLLFPYVQMVPVIAKNVLGVGPGLMGMLLAAEGLGALTGAVLIAASSRMSYHGRVFFVGSMVGLLMLLLLSLSQWYGASLAIMLMLGFGTAGFGTMQGTIVVLVAREDMRGRSLGVLTLAIGAAPLGSLMLGAIANTIGVPLALRINAMIGLVLVGLVGLLMASLRQRMTADEEEEQEQAGAATASEEVPQRAGAGD